MKDTRKDFQIPRTNTEDRKNKNKIQKWKIPSNRRRQGTKKFLLCYTKYCLNFKVISLLQIYFLLMTPVAFHLRLTIDGPLVHLRVWISSVFILETSGTIVNQNLHFIKIFRTQCQMSTLTCWLTAICNSCSRGYYALIWPL